MTKRINENQIVKILDEAKTGAMRIEELCRKHGISTATYYNWKDKYAGMTLADIANNLPIKIRSDNGREFRSHNIAKWCSENNVQWEFIQPGKPMQNGYCERFNGTFRHELLNVYEFNTLAEVKLRVKLWMDEYNNERPHNRFNGLTPMQYEMRYMENV
ncbi:MAG: integrase core domain-containing protein [Burkholderiales bacterium]|nr:integrase core domain-containing protein [Burkholderiales bacterium]